MLDKIDSIGLLEKQAQELTENFRTTFVQYMTWYTFSVTMNLAALAFASKAPHEFPVAVIFLILDLLACVFCALFYRHVATVIMEIESVRRELWSMVATRENTNELIQFFRPTIPQSLAKFAVAAQIVGLLLVALIWAYILASKPSMSG